MAPPKDIARSYPKRGLTADVGFRSEPAFVGDGSVEYVGTNGLQFDGDHTFVNGFSVAGWYWVDGTQNYNYAGFAGATLAWGFPYNGTRLNFYQKATSTVHETAAGTLTPKQWNHIAFTLSQDGLTVKAYLNGVELTIAQPSVAIVLPSLTNIGHAGIASFQNAASGAPVTLPYSGLMANQIWYDGVLTQDEVRQLMRAPNYAVASTIVTPQFYFELFSGITDSTGNATTVEDRGTTTTAYGVNRPQLPRGLDLARGAAMARVYTGRCVDFDGTADRLIGATYDGGGTETTMLYWFNTDTTSAPTMPFANGGASNSRNQLQTLIASGILRPMDASVNIPFSIEAGRWYMLAIVGDSGGLKKAYLDGVDGGAPVAYGHSITATQFVIGARSNAPSQPFNGKIAGFKIFDVELTQAQIRELYHNPEQVLPTGVSASNLRRYYPLSDYNDTGGTGGRYFQDMGADGEPAVDQGSCTMAFAQPVPCPQLGLQQSATRLWHPGASQGATATIAAPGTTVSLSAWIFWDQARLSYPINLGDAASSSGDGLNIRIDGTGQITMYQSGGPLLSGLTITEGEWNHIVVATRSDSPYWRCWLNNSEASSPDALVNTVNITSTNCNLGMSNYILGMGGIANDAAVWNTELGDSDVAALYNSGVQGMDVSTVQSANLLGWWKFDDLTTLKDYSGNGANATVTGTFAAASFPENASGSTIVGDFSMKRKGVSVLNFAESANAAEAVIPAESSLFPNAIGSTIRVWVKGRRSSNAGYVIRSATTTTLERVAVATQTSNEWLFDFPRISGSSTYIPCPLTYDGEWHCMTATIDSATNTIKAYTDGILQATLTTSVVNTAATPSDISINPDVSTYWSGVPVALLKISQQTWTDDEVQRNYYSDLRLIKGLANE